jgi:hypothetical protein
MKKTAFVTASALDEILRLMGFQREPMPVILGQYVKVELAIEDIYELEPVDDHNTK